MKCPFCGHLESKVVDSRPAEEGASIRRRRECLECRKRFTTYEIVDNIQIMVIKKDGTKEFFDRRKIIAGILKACHKRPVDAEMLARAEFSASWEAVHRPPISVPPTLPVPV